MNSVKRLLVGLNASIDQFLAQVENHEALAESGIQEVERAAGQARGHLKKVELSRLRLEQRIAECQTQAGQWSERARGLRNQNEDAALECVRRLKIVQESQRSLAEKHRQLLEMEDGMTRQLRQIQGKVEELRTKKRLLATRQAQTEAKRVLGLAEGTTSGSVEGVFERWETKLETCDLSLGSVEGTDAFEAQFLKEEEKKALKELLASLPE